GVDKEGYNKLGFDKEGYNRSGYDVKGFNKAGYNKNGYDKLGYNKKGYDVKGYDKEGYNLLGFDMNGFDMNGYNEIGEFSEFINKYIEENTKLNVKNSKFIYSDEVRNLFIDIQRAKRNFEIEDYIGAISHIRRGGEVLMENIFLKSTLRPYEYIKLDFYNKINFAKSNNLINLSTYENITIIRESGNKAVHNALDDKHKARQVIDILQNEVEKWIDKNN
uniref:hypothetical protein n=1 Tax=uncultured Clostridium sp. TaxID=59620 RepID=UPI00261ECE79